MKNLIRLTASKNLRTAQSFVFALAMTAGWLLLTSGSTSFGGSFFAKSINQLKQKVAQTVEVSAAEVCIVVGKEEIAKALNINEEMPLAFSASSSMMAFGFTNSGQSLGTSKFSDPQMSDMDNDGDLDIVFINTAFSEVYIYKNDGTGIFTLAHTISSLGTVIAIEIGKFDTDNFNDIFIGGNGFYKNNGSATAFTNTQSTSALARGAVAGDFENDGDIDVFVTTQNGIQVFYENDGTGSFTEKNINRSSDNRGASAGNFDSDSDLELLSAACSCSPDEEIVYDYNSGTNTFDYDSDLPLSTNGTNTWGAVTFDFNGDGYDDILTAEATGTANSGAKYYESTGTGSIGFANPVEYGTSLNGYGIITGDFDDDGSMDFYLSNSSGGDQVFLGDGAGGFSSAGLTLSTAAAFGVAAGDVDADGDVDVFILSEAGNELWLNTTYVDEPEIDVFGNAVEITDGETVTSTADHTDFDGNFTRTFTIENNGTIDLNISGITFSGTNAADFSITSSPTSPVAASGSTTFEVTFAPSGTGTRTATVEIANDDADENPYDFAIEAEGTAAGALNFDGTDDYVDYTSLVPQLNAAVSVEAWVNVSSYVPTQGIISESEITGGTVQEYSGYTLYIHSSGVVRWILYTGTDDQGRTDSPSAIPLNTWTHIAGTYDGTNMHLYIDGVLVDTEAQSGAIDFSPTPVSASVGRYNDSNEEHNFHGSIDEARIWNRGLSQAEIQAQKDCQLTGSECGLLVYYDFENSNAFAGANNPGETTVNDLTANSNDGTVTNFALTGNTSNWVENQISGACSAYSLAEITVDEATVGTDFGNQNLNTASTELTYTITNDGGDDLDVSAVTSSDPQFTIANFTAGTIAPASTLTFDVIFTPTAAGAQTSTISIANTDCDENPYTFTVMGTGVVADPEIDVLGNSVSITDGDTSPVPADDTDFGDIGNGSSDTHTFTIENQDVGDLIIPVNGITINSDVSGIFTLGTVSETLPFTLVQNATMTFEVIFTPNAGGSTVFDGDVSIDNNDADENPYNFDLKGTGIEPEMDVQGGSLLVSIADGETNTSTTDDTEFGILEVGGTPIDHIFTIENTGTGDLTITGFTTSNTTDFSITNGSLPITVAASGTEDFTITFDPQAAGAKTSTISIDNDDPDENPYDFVVGGTGTDCNTATWDDGGGDDDWSNPLNWDNDFVPTACNDVVISTGDPVSLSATAAIKSLTMNSNSSLTIAATHVLSIDGSTDKGIYMSGSTDLMVSGTLNIDNTVGIGLHADGAGTIENNGTINIGQTTAIGGVGITAKSTIINNNSGSFIIIDDAAGGISTANSTPITNLGTIEIGQNAAITGIGVNYSSSGLFSNQGTIKIDNTSSIGISHNVVGGSFENHNTLEIGKNATIGGLGFFIKNSSFDNKAAATISIDNCTTGISTSNGSSITNAGTIEIGKVAALSGAGINYNSSGTFTNASTGIFDIENTGTQGIVNNGTFVNDNSIIIDNAGTHGFQNGTADNFTNNGTLTITNSTSNGFQNNGHLINNATKTIDISGSGGIGMITASTSTSFSNSGTINIASSTGASFSAGLVVANDGTITTNGGTHGIQTTTFGDHFTNNGTLTITNPATGIEVPGNSGASTFTNSNGASVAITGASTTGIGDGIYDLQTGSTFTNDSDWTPGQTFTTNINIEVVTGAIFTIATGQTTNLDGGTFTNNGTITCTALSCKTAISTIIICLN